jgi:TolA-binding protein
MITVTAAYAENTSSDQGSEKSMSLKDLSSQMKAMQEEINRLREEAEVRNKLEATVEEKTDHEKEILSAAGQDYSQIGRAHV